MSDIFKILGPPLVGAVIGYFTNYVAVIMLFHPKREIKLFGHTLPFTPGAIPKEKPRIGKKIGEIIRDNLLTSQDILDALKRDELKGTVVKKVLSYLEAPLQDQLLKFSSSEEIDAEETKESISEMLSDEIVQALLDAKFEETVKEQGSKMILARLKGSLLSMLVGERTVNRFMEGVAEKLKEVLKEDGRDYISSIVKVKGDEYAGMSVEEMLGKLDISSDVVKIAISNIYDKIVDEGTDRILHKVNIAELVENRIDAMSIDEVEDMVLSVMKKEFTMIVNLGALIGFVLGLVNLLFLS